MKKQLLRRWCGSCLCGSSMLQPRLGHLHDLPLPTSCNTRRHPHRLPPSTTCQSHTAPHHCDLLGDQCWSCCLWSGNRHGLPANVAKLPDKGMMLLALTLLHFIVLTVCRISRPYRDAQDRLLWRDKTCPART